MTLLDRRTVIAAGLSFLTCGGARAYTPPEGFAVEDAGSDRVATIRGPRLVTRNHTLRLISTVDKQTGQASDAVVVQIKYQTYKTIKIRGATTDGDRPLAISGHRGASNCPVAGGCVVYETATVALPRNATAAERDRPLAITLRGPGGSVSVALEVETMKAHQRVVEGYRQSIKK